ncbi:hypothetical protein AGMMS50230_03170 [Spirochaetia bacterium]|nr:hypothetical protein AGMMS50230_03170 [Spirochaetia bacterium]
MTIEEVYTKLDTLLKGLPASGFDVVADGVADDFSSCSSEAESLGMKCGKQLIINMVDALKDRKNGGKSDESVLVRLTALDFYVKKLQSGATEDL